MDNFNSNKTDICLNTYDLKQRLKSEDSKNLIICKDEKDGIWYSGIVAYGKEYVFSQLGVESANPGETLLGKPNRTETLGNSEIPFSIFFDFVLTLGETKYRPGTYNLRSLNGNNFTDDLSQFLCGVAIPKYILHLPHIVYESPIGEEEVLPLVERISPGGSTVGGKSVRSSAFLSGYVPKAVSRQTREDSPELQELEAQINALKANQRSLDEKRDKLRKYKKSSSSSKSASPSLPLEPPEVVPENTNLVKRVSFQVVDPVPDESAALVDIEIRPPPAPDAEDRESRSPSLPPSLEEISPEEEQQGEPPLESVIDLPIDEVVEVPVIEPLRQDIETVVESKIPSQSEQTKSASAESPLIDFESEPTTPLQQGSPDKTSSKVEEDKIESELQNRESPNNTTKEEDQPSEEVTVPEQLNEENMADQEATNGAAAAAQDGPPPAEGAEVEVPKKCQKPKEPPVTFRDFEHTKDFEDLVRTVVTMLNPEEQDRLREMEDWIIKGEGTWVLAEGFNAFLGRILHDKALPSEARVAMMRLFAYGAEQDDIVLILHMDRKDHLVMNYAQEFDRMPVKEQEAVALFFANLFENNSSSEWLLYISEWNHKGQDLSNIRVTTKVAVNALLGDTAALRDYGSAIMHNLGTKEVFDDVCTELAMAIMEFFQGKPNEDQVFRCLKALNKFCTIAHREVPQLVKMIGPDPSKFSGMSARADELIGAINARLATVPMF